MSDVTIEFENLQNFQQTGLPFGLTESACREIITRVLNGAAACLPPLSNEVQKDIPQSVFVCLTGDEEIRQVNLAQRGIDRATDVLSFPMLEHKDGMGEIDPLDIDPELGTVLLGDILISVEKIKEQAEEYGHSQERELAFLVCHGYLHLRGFDHIQEEDAARMNATAEKILTKLGYTRESKGVKE